MGKETEIAWCDHTFNPWWGCVRVSPGCEHCYAETFSERVGLKVWGAKADHRRFGDKHWNEPHKWNRDAEKAGVRRRVFCASMADVFEGRDEDAADRERLWTLIEETPWLDWLLLTKRPQNMIALAPERWANQWPRNIWAGCTVEDQQRADERILQLRRVPAAVRFLSVEPMLGVVTLRREWLRCPGGAEYGHGFHATTVHADGCRERHAAISWVIVGGESGPGARPFDLAWAESLSEQCRAAGVPYFFKQAGAVPVLSEESWRAMPSTPLLAARNRKQAPPGMVPLALKSKKGGDVAELARAFPELAAAGVFRREWPATQDGK